VRVTATRAPDTLATVPWSVGVAGVRELRRGQLTIGLDEALGGIPGVYVANRFNYAVDQRVAVRGFGARANFGLRSVTVLLDGVPQTLPDGQSQLTNVELGAVSRVEVLRGASSALWGNGSGGVIAFETDLSAPARLQQALRVEGGAFGLRKAQLRTAGRTDRAVGMLSLSRLTTDGFRRYSAADLRLLNAGVDYAIADRWSASLRAHAASMPEAQNPGALTFAEWRANPDSASAFNILRGAGKTVDQQQLSLALRRDAGSAGGTTLGLTTWGIRRDLANPIAAPPPGGGTTPASGTLVTIDRGVGGLRLDAARPIGAGPRAPTLAIGGDVQRMRDHRRNQRVTGGRPALPTDTLVVDQVETVTSVGGFARLGWMPVARLRLEGGGRYDRLGFAVDDHFRREHPAACTELTCQEQDDSGERTLGAWSGHLGASVAVAPWLVPYANLSTAFETPTTTELQTGREALGGFTTALGPQRTRAGEIGARGDAGRLQYTAALFTMQVRDAIVQYTETGNRAFFTNAGRTRTTGAEVQARVRAAEALGVEAAYTWTRATFGEYRVARGAAVDTLDGNRQPGVPARMLRVGLRAGPVRGLSLDVDHTATSDLFADDANAQRVPGWRRGRLDARATWSGQVGAVPLQPFVGVLNLLEERYVAAVTVNGANGRVLEPGTPRAIYAGVELGWRTAR
jgi:iron complex outermembrane receptor protein